MLHKIFRFEFLNSELSLFVCMFFFFQIYQKLDEAVAGYIIIDVLSLQND